MRLWGIDFVMDLKMICEKYFYDPKSFSGQVKSRHLKPFDETTPEGNQIQGYICVKANKYMGSMLITHVNGEETNQFIQSIPKINYFKNTRDIGNETVSYCYEKLDGTCLIMYPLMNKDGEVIEIIPKIRNHPIMPSHFRQLFNRVDQKPIQEYYKNNTGILIFELYGILNPHQILHYDTGIGIKLLTVYNHNMFYRPEELSYYGFETPDVLFKLTHFETEWILKVTTDKFKHYLGRDIYTYPTNIDAIDGIKDILEKLNKEYHEYNHINAIEGVVIYTSDSEHEARMLKCKPRDIEKEHRSQYGVPRRSITKEVLKYFDDYGDEKIKEIYLEDENHHTEYIRRMLSEEYPIEIINLSSKKIERVFMQIWEARQIPESLYNICSRLIMENEGADITTLMREFARQYPMKKKQANTVYGILERKIKKQGE